LFIETVTLMGFALVVALLVAIVLELREARKSFDSLRSILADAVGIPLPDLIESRTPEPGTVTIPQQLRDLLHVEGGESEDEPRGDGEANA
jgi:hypothetical protein